jgi:spore maturation protein CgeB
VRIAFFYHSVRSDWNNGYAHFLRGTVRALISLGHDPVCYEEAGNWSTTNLVARHGLRPLVEFRRRFPFVETRLYQMAPLADLERRLARELRGYDAVIVNEWPAVEQPELLDLLVRLRRPCGYALLFHDAHHRILTQPDGVARMRPQRFDAILAFAPSIADEYRRRFGHPQIHVFHEAADLSLFHPRPPAADRPLDDALFIGNWGEGDRADEMREFLLEPARRFSNERVFAIHGVRYPADVLATIKDHYGIRYRGWLPNHLVPAAFAQTRVGIHVIRRQYLQVLYGTPTIRVFEALACGTALVSTRWQDTDGLFRAGKDYVVVDTRSQMEEALDWLWRDAAARERIGRSGAARVQALHTCRHRVEQLVAVIADLRGMRVAPQRDVRLPRAVAANRIRRRTVAAMA